MRHVEYNNLEKQILEWRCIRYSCKFSFRRDIRYIPCREVKIALLLNHLLLRVEIAIGGAFLRGHFEIGAEDFIKVVTYMLDDEEQVLSDIKLSKT